MPWRVPPDARAAGVQPDPYRVWLSEVMLQQTTVAAVRSYFERFTARWPKVGDLAAAEDADVMAEWAGLGYYARARNLLKCARAVATDHAGRFPDTEAGLRALPGVGPYTAAAVASIAFDRPATVIDGNVDRVITRLRRIETPLPTAKPLIALEAARLTPAARPGDYAQAIMDLGATICTPRNPVCALCPWSPHCAGHAAGDAATFPRKATKPEKPQREGDIWITLRPTDGAVLLEERPAKGLLGGMAGFPTSGWDGSDLPPPLTADWQQAGLVRHTFTHFHLTLRVWLATSAGNPTRGQFVPRSRFAADTLPTVMRKAWDAAAKTASLRAVE
ncbi:A/G-specific adenine glycosylase [Gemmobacter serpentinus]|uniref:A/G-specific adenine glycosylase n=1 Tax=Gemmobacter serpentinus TaxID=2652247 RepID=UPI00124E1545|nr:A/G-specific adenine glycosylase [Gemmobacter serpentinus]